VDLEVRTSSTGVVLVLRGRITGDDASILGKKIDELLRAGGRKFALDLEGVSHLDSASLGEIVRLYCAVSTQGGTLKLLNLGRYIKNLLPPSF
jgi:anti-anti-sigma factor